MCRPLAVTCRRQGKGNAEISDHIFISPDIKIPCKNAGTQACKWEVAPSADFQAAPTSCAADIAGLAPYSEEGKALCHAALEKYATAVFRMNTQGLQSKKKKIGWGKWLKSWVATGGEEGKKAAAEEKAVVQRKEGGAHGEGMA